ncbi:AraC family transcriptional regulator [Ideonella sp. DXS29W]|uniref:AraC family transcriptional regulator n=1 Tax=Ideonella lacteola TaxID=2984193 RepID=A0ABU9C197_9BURK
MLQRVHPPVPDADDDRVEAARRSLAAAIQQRAPEGQLFRLPDLPNLAMFRSGTSAGPVCGIYETGVALIVQGSKRVLLGNDSFVYGPDHFLIASLNLPAVAQILEATPERPYLSVMLRLDAHEIAQLMMDGHVPPPRPQAAERAMGTGRVTPALLGAFQRLVALLDEPTSIPALAPLIQREIVYRLLMSEQGDKLRQIGSAGSQSHQIGRAIDWLKTHFAEPLRVEALAEMVRMSPSTFHHHFRALTAMSPLQYQKWLRLTEARRLMLADRIDASTAAFRVGYESPSQFSREYSRQFGAPPMRDIAGLRGQPQAADSAA